MNHWNTVGGGFTWESWQELAAQSDFAFTDNIVDCPIYTHRRPPQTKKTQN